jgi:putative ABC transport system permease protein
MKKARIIKSSFRVMVRHKLRTFFMTIGIVVGITALTIIFSLGKGTEKKVMGIIEKIFDASSIMITAGGGRMMGGPLPDTIVTTLTMEDMKVLEQEIAGIAVWDPMQMMPAREVKYRENSANIRVLGHSPKAEVVWNRGVSRGDFFDDADMETFARVALIGEEVVNELFVDREPLGETIRIGNVPFRVKGVLDIVGADPHGMNRDSEIYVPITTAMRRLMNVDYIMAAKLLVEDPDEMDDIVKQITQILRERHNIGDGEPDDFAIMTPVQVKEMVHRALRIFNILLPLIAGISLLVGGVVAANLMLISVSERTSEIGLRKAVGARSKDVLFQFLLETTAITVSGGIIGILLGIFGVQAVANMMSIPVAISIKAIILGIIFSSLVGLVSGIAPARRASKFQPVETLR